MLSNEAGNICFYDLQIESLREEGQRKENVSFLQNVQRYITERFGFFPP